MFKRVSPFEKFYCDSAISSEPNYPISLSAICGNEFACESIATAD